MKTILTTALLALSLAVPAAAQSGTDLSTAQRIAIANHNSSEDSPNQRIFVPDAATGGSVLSTRSGGLSRAQRIAIANHNSSEDSANDRILANGARGTVFGGATEEGLSRAQRIAIEINNASATSSSGRTVLLR